MLKKQVCGRRRERQLQSCGLRCELRPAVRISSRTYCSAFRWKASRLIEPLCLAAAIHRFAAARICRARVGIVAVENDGHPLSFTMFEFLGVQFSGITSRSRQRRRCTAPVAPVIRLISGSVSGSRAAVRESSCSSEIQIVRARNMPHDCHQGDARAAVASGSRFKPRRAARRRLANSRSANTRCFPKWGR